MIWSTSVASACAVATYGSRPSIPFFRYAAFELPTHAAQIQRVLAIPTKRFTRTLISFLSRPEVDALLATPDRSTWSGRRDYVFILTAVQTGLRLSEMTGLKREDLIFG